MLLSRPSTSSMRPAYLDGLFRDSPPTPLPSPGVHSASSSISSSSSSTLDLRSAQAPTRPLSPAFEEDDNAGSVRSLRLNLSPRFNVRNMFNRRTYPSAREISTKSSSSSAAPVPSRQALRRPSLPRLQTSFSSPPRRGSAQKEKPLPAAPVQPAREVTCHRCYYFAARNCNGWVMDGTHGDACEQCLVRCRFNHLRR